MSLLPLLAGLGRAAERDPLPSLPVERPVVLPRGWATVELAAQRAVGPGAVEQRLVPVARYAPLRGLELRVAVPLVHARVDEVGVASGPGDAALGLRLGLMRREPPNRSVAVDVIHRAPLGGAPRGIALGAGTPGLEVGLVGALQGGPFLASLRVAGMVGAEPGAIFTPGLLLQVGPLFPWGDLTWVAPGPFDGRAGLGLQLTRGLALRGSTSRGPQLRGGALAVEVAL